MENGEIIQVVLADVYGLWAQYALTWVISAMLFPRYFLSPLCTMSLCLSESLPLRRAGLQLQPRAFYSFVYDVTEGGNLVCSSSDDNLE